MVSPDFSSGASALFANVRLPASILAGALVPLGFGFALPVEGAAFTKQQRRSLIRLHRVVSVIAYACLLICIVYASVSINSLAEIPQDPANSIIALIRRDYELAWVATNVTFFFGLSGALVLVALRALLSWEEDEGKVGAGFCGAALLLMASVVDEQVKAGGYSADLVSLIGLFFAMGFAESTRSRSWLLFAGLALSVGSSVAAVNLLTSDAGEGSGGGSGGVAGAGVVNDGRSLTTSQVDTVVATAVGADGDGGSLVSAAGADDAGVVADGGLALGEDASVGAGGGDVGM